MINPKRKIGEFLLKIAEYLLRNNEKFKHDLKHSVNYELMCVSVCETGDHLRADLQPAGNLMVDTFLRTFRFGIEYNKEVSKEKDRAGYYLDIWKGQNMDVQQSNLTDVFGFEINIGDEVYYQLNNRIVLSHVVEKKNNEVRIHTDIYYPCWRSCNQIFNKTAVEKMKMAVYPEDYI